MLEPRISIVTLGVDDLPRATAFYQALGLRRHERYTDGVSFFQMGGLILALWPRADLARDAGLAAEEARATAGVALAYNTREASQVEAVLELARRAGATVIKPAQAADWGGVQGYFRDTEGNLWEVAYNPDFPIDADGRTALPQ